MPYKVKAVVDRFEGEKAVLLVGAEEVQAVWPLKFMPDTVVEGTILMINITVDTEATCQARGQAEDLLRQLLVKNKQK